MGLCAGMGTAGSPSNSGVNVAIPIGIALKKLVSAARNQRKAKLAPKLENAVSDVIGGVGGDWDETAGGTLYSIFFKLFNDYFKDNVMGLGGMGLWNRYPRETVNPSFEPQPPSLMLKMRFLRRSGRKYEKSGSFGHGVSWVLATVVRWAFAFLPVFGEGKLRKMAQNSCKKWTKISGP